MCVVVGNSLERELGMEPFTKGGRLRHIGLIVVGLTTCKEVQIHLGDERAKFSDLGVLKWVAGKPAVLKNPN